MKWTIAIQPYYSIPVISNRVSAEGYTSMIEVELVQPAEQPTEQLHILIYVKELEEEGGGKNACCV